MNFTDSGQQQYSHQGKNYCEDDIANSDRHHPELMGPVGHTMFTTRNVIVEDLGGRLIAGAEIVANPSGFAVTGCVIRDNYVIEVSQKITVEAWGRLFKHGALTGAFESCRKPGESSPRSCGTRPAPRPNPAPRTPCERKAKKRADSEKSACSGTYISKNEFIAEHDGAFARILRGDSRKVLPKMEKGSVQCVLTDGPYNVLKGKNAEWDERKLPIPKLAKYIRHCVSDDGVAIIFCSFEQIARYWKALKGKFDAITVGTWVKLQPFQGKYGVTGATECFMIAWSHKAKHLNTLTDAPWNVVGSARFSSTERVMLDDNEDADSLHLTQKPVELITRILRKYVPAGATVLDPFAGTAAIGRACLLSGYNYIGIEKEENYFERATLAFMDEKIMESCHGRFVEGSKSMGANFLDSVNEILMREDLSDKQKEDILTKISELKGNALMRQL